MFRLKMKQLFGSFVFWGIVILFAVIISAGAYGDLVAARNNSLSVLYLYLVTSTVGIAHVLVPVITIIPFAFFYVDEMEKKAIYYNLIRSNKRSCYLSNIAVAVLSPMIISFFALLLFVLVCLIFGAGFKNGASEVSFYFGTIYGDWLENGHLVWVLLIQFLAFMIYSAPWGALCLVASVFSKNKYVIIAFPFIFDNVLGYICQSTPLFMLDPGLTLLKGPVQEMPYGGIIYSLGYHAVFVIILSIIYYVMSKRRYRHGGI